MMIKFYRQRGRYTIVMIRGRLIGRTSSFEVENAGSNPAYGILLRFFPKHWTILRCRDSSGGRAPG